MLIQCSSPREDINDKSPNPPTQKRRWWCRANGWEVFPKCGFMLQSKKERKKKFWKRVSARSVVAYLLDDDAWDTRAPDPSLTGIHAANHPSNRFKTISWRPNSSRSAILRNPLRHPVGPIPSTIPIPIPVPIRHRGFSGRRTAILWIRMFMFGLGTFVWDFFAWELSRR